jgi:uncharacterized protein (DUF2147 family)
MLGSAALKILQETLERPPMRHLLFAFILAAGTTPALAADPVQGEWLTVGGSGKVRIAPCPARPERMCGTLVWLKDPVDAKRLDANNPDQALRSRPLVGLPMIRDFKPAAPGRWTGGKIYDPESGKTYDSKIAISGNGTLKVEGCVLMLCQAQTWRRS